MTTQFDSITDYLHNIKHSRVYDVAKITPLEFQENLSKRINNQVFLKREITDCP